MAVRTPGLALPGRPRPFVSAVVVVLVLLVLGGVFVSLYTDLLWFRETGHGSVFTTVLGTKVKLFVMFGLLMALVVGANLAIAYRALKKWDEGLAASDRAMKLAYGPRKLTFYTTRADLYTGKGDTEGARRRIEEAVAFAKALPAGQRSDATIASLEKRLAGMKPAAVNAR